MLSALLLSMLMIRGGSRTAATSKNGWKPLTIITKCSILDVAAVLDPPLSVKGKETQHMKEDMGQKYSRMDQEKCFKGCLPQVLLGPFLNILSHVQYCVKHSDIVRYSHRVSPDSIYLYKGNIQKILNSIQMRKDII